SVAARFVRGAGASSGDRRDLRGHLVCRVGADERDRDSARVGSRRTSSAGAGAEAWLDSDRPRIGSWYCWGFDADATVEVSDGWGPADRFADHVRCGLDPGWGRVRGVCGTRVASDEGRPDYRVAIRVADTRTDAHAREPGRRFSPVGR